MADPLTCKRLYRSREHRIFAGVCGGLAEYFNVDPVIFRVIWACAALFSALIGAALVYGICILAIPLRPQSA
ncbi:MAG: PspC domain-containing protein [Verrucomicrobiae bacterium]|nr:PspC domain-containing protein [Verrucomicrobiae bacterium]